MRHKTMSISAIILMSVLAAPIARGADETPGLKPTPGTTSVPDGQAEYAAANDAITRVNEVLGRNGVTSDVALEVVYAPDELIAHTQLPANSSPMVQAAEAAAPIAFSIHRTEFPVGRLLAEARRLANQPGVSYASPTEDYDGVLVSLREGEGTTVPDSDFPLDVAEPSDIVPASRNADTKPVYGGALLKHNTANVVCSAGIGVKVGGELGFTTAQHCPIGTYSGYNSGVNLGTSNSGHAASAKTDTRFVRAGTWSRNVWTGPWNSSSSTYTYRAASNPANGQRICADGGITGEVCGETYVRGTGTYAITNGIRREPGFWIFTEIIVRGYQRCVVNQGDSGSPAYNYTSNGQLDVRGLVIATDTSYSTTYCPNMHPDYHPIQTTSSRAFAINIVAALNSIGASPAAS